MQLSIRLPLSTVNWYLAREQLANPAAQRIKWRKYFRPIAISQLEDNRPDWLKDDVLEGHVLCERYMEVREIQVRITISKAAIISIIALAESLDAWRIHGNRESDLIAQYLMAYSKGYLK